MPSLSERAALRRRILNAPVLPVHRLAVFGSPHRVGLGRHTGPHSPRHVRAAGVRRATRRRGACRERHCAGQATTACRWLRGWTRCVWGTVRVCAPRSMRLPCTFETCSNMQVWPVETRDISQTRSRPELVLAGSTLVADPNQGMEAHPCLTGLAQDAAASMPPYISACSQAL